MTRILSPEIEGISRALLRSRALRGAAIAVAYLFIYMMADWLSAVRPALTIGVTPWNPETGITLAFLLVCGVRWLPITAVAVFLSELLIHNNHAAPPVLLATSLWITLVYGALAAILRHWNLSHPIGTTAAAVRFATSSAAAALFAASGYIGLFAMLGELSFADAPYGIARYGFADLNGILTLTPLLVHCADLQKPFRVLRKHFKATLVQLACVVTTMLLLFALPAADQLRFFYLLFLPIIWIALRWRIAGSIFAVLAIDILLVTAAQTGIHTPRFIDLQVFMLALTLTALLLGAVVADRRRAEEQLREKDASLARAMRFAVAGELASALAHELNQPITALVSYLRASEILVARGISEEGRLRETLGKAVQEIMRASDVLRRLRDFYRGVTSRHDLINLPGLCGTVTRAFQERLRGANTSIEIHIDSPIPAIAGDAIQVEIVLHNLLANAVDAVTGLSGRPGRIELRVARSGQSVLLRVEDSGPGIEASVAPRLFEPFVTSKEDGMGLGLAISRTLAQAWGGELIQTVSERLGGACFTIRLPVATPANLPVSQTREDG